MSMGGIFSPGLHFSMRSAHTPQRQLRCTYRTTALLREEKEETKHLNVAPTAAGLLRRDILEILQSPLKQRDQIFLLL